MGKLLIVGTMGRIIFTDYEVDTYVAQSIVQGVAPVKTTQVKRQKNRRTYGVPVALVCALDLRAALVEFAL